MAKEHPIEAAWLRFRKRHFSLLEMSEKVYEGGWHDRYPNADTSLIAGVPMPAIECTQAILANKMDKEQSLRTIVGDLGGEERMDFLQTASSLLAYRGDKTIVTIDPVLFDSLKNTKFPDKFLTSNLVLPARAVVLHREGSTKSVIAFFDMSGPESGDPATYFKLSEFDHITGESRLQIVFEIKEGETLQQALDHHLKWKWSRQQEIEAVRSEDAGYSSLIGREGVEEIFKSKYAALVQESLVGMNGYLNCILYSIGNDDIVTAVGKRKTSNDPKKAKRLRDLAGQTHSKLGTEYGKTVQRFIDEAAKAAEASEKTTGKPKQPHIRSGHAHLYWKNHPTEKGKKVQIVHYLPPIPVGMKWTKEAKDATGTKLK